jgi:hypothetical protein
MSYTDKELKLAVAEAVFGNPTRPFDFSTIDGHQFDVHDIEMRRESPMEMRIKVTTEANGTHWYGLKLSEKF